MNINLIKVLSSINCYAFLLLLFTSSLNQNANMTVSQCDAFHVLPLLKAGSSGPVVAPPWSSNDRRYQTHSDIVSLPVSKHCKLQHNFASVAALLLYFTSSVVHSTFCHLQAPKKLQTRVLQHP